MMELDDTSSSAALARELRSGGEGADFGRSHSLTVDDITNPAIGTGTATGSAGGAL